jgi:hypothetical protein
MGRANCTAAFSRAALPEAKPLFQMMFRGEQRHRSAVCVLPELQVGYRAHATTAIWRDFEGKSLSRFGSHQVGDFYPIYPAWTLFGI